MKIEITKGLLKKRTELIWLNEQMKNRIITDEKTGLKFYSGYAYDALYDWDQYFEALVQIYMGWGSAYIKNGVLVFLASQRGDGFIHRIVNGSKDDKYSLNEHVKPFLAQTAMLVVENYGETDWILKDELLVKLDKYMKYWLYDMDKDKNGLSEWLSAPHTGMDNQHERAGYWDDGFCEGTDLNSYLVSECRALAKLFGLRGDKAKSKEYLAAAEERKNKINSVLWNEKDGFYYDRNIYYNKRAKSPRLPWPAYMNCIEERYLPDRCVSSFMPLYCGVASKEQAARLVKDYLLNPDEFWSEYPVRTMSKSARWYSQERLPADLGCDWRASVWIPVNYMIIRGLRDYGFNAEADTLASQTARLVKTAGNREWYAADTGKGCGQNPFWGWSLLGYFAECEM